MTKTIRLLCLASAALPLAAQSFDDLTSFRTQELPYTQLVQLRAGLMGSMASGKDKAAGLDDELAIDGSLFYHDENFGNKGAGQIDAYVGRDGFFGSIKDGRLIGGQTVSRLELKARLWPFWREGYYQGKSFVPTGRYEGRDYEAYLGFGREVADALFVEFGPFYRRNQFSRDRQTDVNYDVPDDYDAYGGRLFLEQRTIQNDRRTGLPREGFALVVWGEREWNDSNGTFGTNSVFTTELPSAVWRAHARTEWYIPASTDATWEIFASGQLADEKDRVVDYEAQHPQGNMWVDGQLRLRMLLSDSLSLSPFVQGQFLRILNVDGSSSDKKFFYGAGAEAWLHFSDAVSLNTWYSYLNNESRPSVSIVEDIHGQHMFWAGIVLRFGATHR